MRRGLGTSGTTLSAVTSESGVPKGEEQEQDTDNLFKQIMKENFPNLAKEIDIQIQEAQNPKQVEPKEEHNKTHHN